MKYTESVVKNLMVLKNYIRQENLELIELISNLIFQAGFVFVHFRVQDLKLMSESAGVHATNWKSNLGHQTDNCDITVASSKFDFEDSTGEDLKAVQMAFEYSKSLNFF